jgi:glucosamine-6-phosphate deaminase
MVITVHRNAAELGSAAAQMAAKKIAALLEKQETVRFIAATGASQFEFLDTLTTIEGVDWSRTTMFHLDEYVGMDSSHPASFVGYLQKRLVGRVQPGTVVFIDGMAKNPEDERERVSQLVTEAPIDIAFIGIGENGHIAFNDPPADFDTETPYLILNLDDACRAQQVGEGWFPDVDAVPEQAYTMSVRQILKSNEIICVVPDKRKAVAVRDCLGPDAKVSPHHPASILKTHPRCHVYLDVDSAALLPDRK